MRIYIYEGLDCTGKSTAAMEKVESLLSKGHNALLIKVKVTDSNTAKWYEALVESCEQGYITDLVLDRSPISEVVYSSLNSKRQARIGMPEVTKFFKANQVTVYTTIVKWDKLEAYLEESKKRKPRPIGFVEERLQQQFSFLTALTILEKSKCIKLVKSYFKEVKVK